MCVKTKNKLEIYLDKLYAKTHDARLIVDECKQLIFNEITRAISVTNLSFDDLLSGLDFKPNDLTIEALESFLAELRSIFWLEDFGFTNILPLEALKTNSNPDFSAVYKGKTCAIEVFCLTQAHEQHRDADGIYTNFDPQFEGSKFGRDFINKSPSKKIQLDSIDAQIKILLCVINSTSIVYLNTNEEMQNHAEFLYNKLGWGENYYLGILTGKIINGLPSDTIFPPLPIGI